MQRVRRNIELLIPRLADLGYRFGYESLEAIQSEIHPQVFAPPATGVTQTTDELEQRIGPLPLSLRAFYEVVGEVNFVGDILLRGTTGAAYQTAWMKSTCIQLRWRSKGPSRGRRNGISLRKSGICRARMKTIVRRSRLLCATTDAGRPNRSG